MSLDSISKSLGTIIDERISSPLVSGFAMSWAVINWKFLVILFSDTTIKQTFENAAALYTTRLDWWCWNFIAPLAASLAYVYVLPLVSRPVHKHWRENQKLIEDDRKLVDDLELLDIDKSRAIRREIYALRTRVDELATERDEALESRKTALKDMRTAQLQRDGMEADAVAQKERADKLQGMSQDIKENTSDLEFRFKVVTEAAAQLHRLMDEQNVSTPDMLFKNLLKKGLISHDFNKMRLRIISMLGVDKREGLSQLVGLYARRHGEREFDLQPSLQWLTKNQYIQTFITAGSTQYELTPKGDDVRQELSKFELLL